MGTVVVNSDISEELGSEVEDVVIVLVDLLVTSVVKSRLLEVCTTDGLFDSVVDSILV